MLEPTKRISFRISSVLSKVEPEPDIHTGSDQKVPAPQHWSCLSRSSRILSEQARPSLPDKNVFRVFPFLTS